MLSAARKGILSAAYWYRITRKLLFCRVLHTFAAGLGVFRTVVLVSSEQDAYVNRASARITPDTTQLASKDGMLARI